MFFLFSKTSIPAVESSQRHIQWLPGFFPGVKRQGREVQHSPASSTDVENEWSYTSPSPVCFHGVNRDINFAFFWIDYLKQMGVFFDTAVRRANGYPTFQENNIFQPFS
jgi:hypothetical protein